ncbi:polyprenyl synthetase family protein [Chachezhania antarctica]|uniref:polyprenyl synthetase family protein n=1 Tax=Chachezhania antarctica TaxID=2340860 RepID=UPI000EB3A733|nr:polyprenyl synthetase family protein [Chachezhania antarctica]|tara:strand:+ start:6412 stop:7278 length:867 start_codon:yes stop_codon:yes gene_type:complete
MFTQRLAEDASAIGAHLAAVLSDLPRSDVAEAMAHAAEGGKRLRGFLVLESARLHDVSEASAIWPACAIEALHAYSLVHDDLPAMDDDDMRRGRPTVHVAWDEATAVLAGDALQALAFDLVTHPETGPADTRIALTRSLAQAGGARGMVLGQARDIAAESAKTPLTLDEITALQAGKTGALFGWSATAGAVLAGADTRPLAAYAAAMGLAFQIADDIIDVTGDSTAAGKRVGKDADAGKATFVTHLGLDGARRRAASLVEEACAALEPYGPRAVVLKDAARFTIARDA